MAAWPWGSGWTPRDDVERSVRESNVAYRRDNPFTVRISGSLNNYTVELSTAEMSRAEALGGFHYEYGGLIWFYDFRSGKAYWIEDPTVTSTGVHFGGVYDAGAVRLGLPESLDGKPRAVWPHQASGNHPAMSFHIDAMRWIRVTAFLDVQGATLDVPLVRDERSYLDPAVPPAMMLRRHVSATDRVTAPNTAGVKWTDRYCWTYGGGTTFGTTNILVGAVLVPKTDPVPHWVARFSTYRQATASGTVNLMLDLIGSSGDTMRTTSYTSGSSGVSGHYQVAQKWAEQGFNSTPPALANLNDRKAGVGAVHVDNDPAGTAVGTCYLTTGASAGGSGGTALFTDLPAVMVLGHKTVNSDVTGSAETAWAPESWGHGVGAGYVTGVTGDERDYYSDLYLDSGTSKHRVDVYNHANDGSGSASTGLDRTFFVHSIGK